jgi:hypothetical protein
MTPGALHMLVGIVGFALVGAAPARAQDQDAGHVAPGWQWTADSNAFFGFNYQRRKFRDFTAWESQNWLMASGRRPAGRGTLAVWSMLSLEALTLRDIGSPQVFQTGETYRRAPLIDYQHPHDLLMGLGAEYRRTFERVTLTGGLDVVGPAAFGPVAFMHRASARENPQAPLSHHYMDSTHITPGVLRGGIAAGEWRAEASWFRGREPDENRLDLDLGRLDSSAARVSWARGPWFAQVSGALLTQPEALAPYDARKLSASLAYTTGDDTRGIAWMAAFGQNREIHGNLEAYLLEANVSIGARTTLYSRIESVAKSILDAGFHPPNAFHRHRQSQVGALTIGYVRDVMRTRAGGFGAGVDVTGYLVPSNLKDPYGAPLSFHLFLRYRAPRPAAGAPVHVH